MYNKTYTLLTWKVVHKNVGHLIDLELDMIKEIKVEI